MEVFWAHFLMVIGRMILYEVIHPIIDSFVPVYLELPLLYPINHLVKVRVEGLAALLVHAPIEEAFGGFILCL